MASTVVTKTQRARGSSSSAIPDGSSMRGLRSGQEIKGGSYRTEMCCASHGQQLISSVAYHHHYTVALNDSPVL